MLLSSSNLILADNKNKHEHFGFDRIENNMYTPKTESTKTFPFSECMFLLKRLGLRCFHAVRLLYCRLF